MSTEKEKPIIVFDATELDNFDSCTFKWHAFHHRRIYPKQTKSFFESGSLLHYILEHYYKQKMITPSVDGGSIEEIIEKGRIKSLDYRMDLEEVGQIIFQFREYVRYYENENIIPIAVEEPFLIELFEDEDIKVLISGKPDLIFKYSHTGDKIVMDHKKVTREFPYSPLRNQFNLYATAMQTDTVIVNKVGFQKTKKPNERFLRAAFVYNPESLAEWRQDVINTARKMLLYEQAEHYPRNRTSCEKFAGCYLQRFCATRPSAREFLIGNEYIIGEPWDVSGGLESKVKEKES